MQVRAYWNVNRRVWSVQGRSADGAWRVIDHADELLLEDARFVVSRAGRTRAHRLGKKVVHAYVEGRLVDGGAPRPGLRRVTYNPFRGPAYFHTEDGRRVDDAAEVYLSPYGEARSTVPLQGEEWFGDGPAPAAYGATR